MIHNPLIFERYRDSFRLYLAVHACASTTAIAEMFIVSVILFGQLALITCLESKDIFLYSVMLGGILLKLTAAWLHVSLAHWGESDAMVYFEEAKNLAAISHRFQDFINPQQIWGTEFIVSITACIQKFLGLSF